MYKKAFLSKILMVMMGSGVLSAISMAQQVEILPKENTGQTQTIQSVPQPQTQSQPTSQPQPVSQGGVSPVQPDQSGKTDILADSKDPETLAQLKDDAEELILEAEFTLRQISRHNEYKDEFNKNIKNAKAVIIFPKVLKGGFTILGAEGGNGIILAKAPNGKWSYPSFYTMVGGSAGLQIGAQSSEMVILVMTDKALVATLKNRVRLGTELNAAVGTEGAGYEKNVTTGTNFKTPDTHSYTINQGLFIGMGLEGSYMVERKAMNQAFYGTKPEEATTKSIIIQGGYANERANPLRAKLYALSTVE